MARRGFPIPFDGRKLVTVTTIGFIGLFGMVVPVAVAANQTADVSVTIVNNSIAVVMGHNFSAGQPVAVSVAAGADKQDLSATAESDGRFVTNTFLPQNYSGNVTVTATQGSLSATASATANTGSVMPESKSPVPHATPNAGSNGNTENTKPSTSPPATGGAACSKEGIEQLVASVSEDNIKKLSVELTTDDSKPKPNQLISRHVSNPGNQIKVDWMTEKLESYGLTVKQQPFTSADGYDLNNAIGRLAGTDPNSYYILGAHIDSIAGDSDNNDVAPGANDDGSGIVVNMEVMRVLQQFQPCMKTSVEIIGFNDEEENFGGSAVYVENLSGNYLGGYNLDPVGYQAGKPECILNTYNTAKDKPLSDAAAAAHEKYGIDLPFEQSVYSGEDIDNVSFWDADQPIAYVAECGDGSYHSVDDTIERLNYSQMTKVAQIMVATLAELAMGAAPQ